MRRGSAMMCGRFCFFFSSRRRHTRFDCDWSSDVCSSDLTAIERETLPRWIAARLARQNQRASDEVLSYLAERCEGNLLAARQEIEKLALVLAEGEIALEAVEGATTDVARHHGLQGSEALLPGDA